MPLDPQAPRVGTDMNDRALLGHGVSRPISSYHGVSLLAHIPGLICQFVLACPAPTPHMPQSPAVITWAHGMELEPPEPPRAAVMAPRNYIAPPAAPSAGGGPSSQSPVPSRGQRGKVAPLGKGVKPPCRAGNCRGLEPPGGLSAGAAKPHGPDTGYW